MKTIGFYSYKGGTGKSVLCSNLAVCLSRLGKNCILVDCDVESPSLHNKFRQVGRGATGRGGVVGGFVGLVDSYFRPNDWASASTAEVVPKATRNVEDFLFEMPAPWDPISERNHGPAGKIYLLAAGNTHNDRYWHVVWSPLWHELFTLYDGYLRGRQTDTGLQKALAFFSTLKSALENINGSPDYMIIDLRAGASELSTTLINAWIDTLVYTFSFNEDSIGYLMGTFTSVWKAGLEREQSGVSAAPFAIESVLCRVPRGIDYKGDRLLHDALRTLRMKESDLHVLHSDRDLEMWEELRVGFQREPENSSLTHEYLQLFEKLIDRNHLPERPLPEVLGLPADVEQQDRVFLCESEVGALINPNDDSRNVSFKVETFQRLLLGLEEGIVGLVSAEDPTNTRKRHPRKQSATEQPQAKDWLARILHAAGRSCGEAFGSALAATWDRGGRDADLGVEAKLRRWCEFDSDVGFGRFELDAMTIEIRGPRLLRCDVILHESFLTPAHDVPFHPEGDHKYCELMTGYIAGVLSKVLTEEVDVKHSTWSGEGPPIRSESCAFQVTTTGVALIQPTKRRVVTK